MKGTQSPCPPTCEEPVCPRRLSLGLCCMASKAASAAMQAILRRLESSNDFDIIIFPEADILTKPAEEWPIVECLIAFASTGFPLEKCREYCRLQNPRCINDIDAQAILCSRVEVYRTLEEANVPCPDHVIVDHPSIPEGSLDFVENENFIVYKGHKIDKPFVEKPEDGDRHDIWIYYPGSIGGGAKKLFRKVKNQSSEFDPQQNTIRRDGTYIYEPFLPTQGTDIKVYTVGAGYVHAEARKAPTVDGKVNRSKDGKEVRYPVVLTTGEKLMAALIVKAFRQNICGFDILRTDGGSLVCDVNGWSFVKGNQKYYNDCATLIRKHFLDQEFGAENVNTSTTMILEAPADEKLHITYSPLEEQDYAMRESRVNRTPERLRSVIVIMRHGDRRPKEKMKFKTKQASILAAFDGLPDGTGEVKLTSLEDLQNLRSRFEKVAETLREELQAVEESDNPDEDKKQSLKEELQDIELLVPVLSMRDRFSGLERKVQLKATKWKESSDGTKQVAQVQVVAKWGGELTVNGLAQAQELGSRLRHDLYPNDPTGLLRLHSSFRHDFKIYSSLEGRCQITAGAFTKGFLDLDGDIIPILVSLVTRDRYSQTLLDEPVPKVLRDQVKKKIENLMLSYQDMSEIFDQSCPTGHQGLREAAYRIGSPLQKLHTIRYDALEYIQEIAAAKDRTFAEMSQHNSSDAEATKADDSDQAASYEDCGDDAVPLGVPVGPGVQIPEDLTDACKRKWLHLRRKEHRWRKLFDSFVIDNGNGEGKGKDECISYNTTKIPDLWDNLYYDMVTHRHYLGARACKKAEQLVSSLHPLNEWVCLSEYGISQEEKIDIGVDVTWRLVGKILNDLEFMIEDDVGSIEKDGKRADSDDNVPRSLSGVSAGSNGRRKTGMPGMGIRSPGEDGPASPQSDPPALSSPMGASRKGAWAEMGSSDNLGDRSTSPMKREDHGLLPPPSSAPAVLSPPLAEASKGFDRGVTPPSDSQPARPRFAKLSSTTKLTPDVRDQLKQAMRDSSDWHPRLDREVTKMTDLKHTRVVRSRVYVTSASTMHSLFNILRHASGEQELVKGLDNTTDLNYLTHLVFRCYEQDEGSDQISQTQLDDSLSPRSRARQAAQARYRVEVSMSPGVQVYKNSRHVQWPKGSELKESTCKVAPLQIIGESLDLAWLEQFLSGAVKEYGPRNDDDDEQEDAGAKSDG